MCAGRSWPHHRLTMNVTKSPGEQMSVSQQATGAKVLGTIGDRILFENEVVRVWIVSLDPGHVQPWHQHHLPYLIVPLTPGKSEIEYEDGTIRRPEEKVGEVVWREKGEIHQLRNAAAWKYQNILVEMKSDPRPTS
jgi:quercetin dioxygenase-like cupin family protein